MYRPSIVVVALGVPGAPLICWADATGAIDTKNSKLDAAPIPRAIFDNDIVCDPLLRVDRYQVEFLSKGLR